MLCANLFFFKILKFGIEIVRCLWYIKNVKIKALIIGVYISKFGFKRG